ncbi:MAG: Rieske (2Fe-2S) protein [Actinomycetota bacterium]|nr:Rieske (2Fe-2S) protein [Actinomycetota bacterium]
MSRDKFHDDDFERHKAGKDNPEDYGESSELMAGRGAESEPIRNPGLPEHTPRPTDVDAALERRAELQVAMMFIGASALALLFCVAYFVFEPGVEGETFLGVGASNLALGVTLGLAMLLIGIGAIQWARKLMGDHEIVEHRHGAASSDEDREEALAAFRQGSEESGFGRRTLIRNSLLGSLGLLGLPAVVLLGDLGPLPGDALSHTVWRRGVRLVNDVDGQPLRPEAILTGQLVNGQPELFFEHAGPDGEVIEPEYEGAELLVEESKAAIIVVRMRPEDITPPKGREDWGIDGILCFSKICTHVGCPISLWEQQTHQLLCPCHQSTFNLAAGGRVDFGPAARSLPQLPLMVDDEGYLVAVSDFQEPVGPSFWERG